MCYCWNSSKFCTKLIILWLFSLYYSYQDETWINARKYIYFSIFTNLLFYNMMFFWMCTFGRIFVFVKKYVWTCFTVRGRITKQKQLVENTNKDKRPTRGSKSDICDVFLECLWTWKVDSRISYVRIFLSEFSGKLQIILNTVGGTIFNSNWTGLSFEGIQGSS